MDQRLKIHLAGYWEVDNKPSVSELESYYAGKYYQEGRGSYEIKYSESEIEYFKAKLEQRWFTLQRLLASKPPKQSPRILDVGCGEGYALAFFADKGWQVRGFDFSAAGVESKNPSCREFLLVGDVFSLLDAEIESGQKYDVVWLQNVLEHVLDPIALLRSLRQLLFDDGVAVVTVPNDCSIVQLAALSHGHIDSAFWVLPPDHLNYFDSESLKAVAQYTDWNCVQLLGDFPIDWLLFHPGSNYVRDPSQGRAAHQARVQIENLIHSQPIELNVEFWAAAGRLGVGRNLTAFLVKADIDSVDVERTLG